jgi:hypothetical protein
MYQDILIHRALCTVMIFSYIEREGCAKYFDLKEKVRICKQAGRLLFSFSWSRFTSLGSYFSSVTNIKSALYTVRCVSVGPARARILQGTYSYLHLKRETATEMKKDKIFKQSRGDKKKRQEKTLKIDNTLKIQDGENV